jgi:hypothetical protein
MLYYSNIIVKRRLYTKKRPRFQGGVFYFWGQALSGLITVLEDKEYMVTVREKMNNIKKVAKFYNYDFLNAGK